MATEEMSKCSWRKTQQDLLIISCDINPCYGMCGGWATSISISWKLVSRVELLALLETQYIKICIWIRSPGELYTYSSLRILGQRRGKSKRWQASILCFLIKGFLNISFFYRFLYWFLWSDCRPGTGEPLVLAKKNGNNWDCWCMCGK